MRTLFRNTAITSFTVAGLEANAKVGKVARFAYGTTILQTKKYTKYTQKGKISPLPDTRKDITTSGRMLAKDQLLVYIANCLQSRLWDPEPATNGLEKSGV